MIVLDTNVVSEFMTSAPDERVADWLDRRPADELFLTAVTVGELTYGVRRLSAGHRRDALLTKTAELLNGPFHGRLLAFDPHAATHYGAIKAEREAIGRPISDADAQIAAICRRHAGCLATRNTKDFVDTGIEVVDPWTAQ
ncbi:hypothetical protein LY13_001179 [Prauserella aidingensis]|uniref:type II toxin-antitoxin system VapC family toxin n=1 Tax=Prauserella aidingensis TaxID=387890 RepID=UPI0020A41BDD|nr:type II toxin-antitoxin system VapC family toxin [Prauserella aidingensis]MCP2252440.1 hypothetical protein [Prauserella aidingensis]